jgi:hypothetical protein
VPLVLCPLCANDEDIDLVEKLPDGRKRVVCRRCHYEWEHGHAREPDRLRTPTSALLLEQFPKPQSVEPEIRNRAEGLKAEFLTTVRREPDPKVAPYGKKYQHIFSAEGLTTSDPADLKASANDPTGVYSGIMTEFNKAWNAMGPEQGAAHARQVIEYLLRGNDPSLENRLTDLILGKFHFSIAGFKEALLSKALAVVYPQRFLTSALPTYRG